MRRDLGALLAERPIHHETNDLQPGALVFYRRPGRSIHHVAIHATNVPDIKLEAGTLKVGPVAFESGGGDSTSSSPRAALRKSAGIRLTASDYHGTGIEWIAKDPFVLL